MYGTFTEDLFHEWAINPVNRVYIPELEEVKPRLTNTLYSLEAPRATGIYVLSVAPIANDNVLILVVTPTIDLSPRSELPACDRKAPDNVDSDYYLLLTVPK